MGFKLRSVHPRLESMSTTDLAEFPSGRNQCCHQFLQEFHLAKQLLLYFSQLDCKET